MRADVHVVLQHPEMRDAIQRIGHARRDTLMIRTPLQLSRTMISVSKSMRRPMRLTTPDRAGGRERIHAQPAHRIPDLERQRVDPHPHMREIAAIAARARHRWRRRWPRPLIIASGCRRAASSSSGTVGHIVLAVGIDLQRVREPRGQRRLAAGHHRRALAAVLRQPLDAHPAGARRDLRQRRLRRRVRAVIDDETGQTERLQRLHHLRDGAGMVVERNDDAGSSSAEQDTRPLEQAARPRVGSRRTVSRRPASAGQAQRRRLHPAG